MSAKSACSPATSRPPAGCSATGSCCRSRRTRRSFQLIGTTYGGDGQEHLRPAQPAGPHPDPPGHPAGYLSARRDRRRRRGHADHQPDPDPHPSAARLDQRPGSQTNPAGNVARRSSSPVSLYIADAPSAEHADERELGHAARRQPAARQHAALSCASTSSSRCSGSFRSPDLRADTRGRSLRRRNPHLSVQFRAQGLGVVRRAAAAAVAEHRAVLAARHHLWRRRQDHLRAAQPAGPSRRCIPARAQGSRSTTSARWAAAETVTLLESRDAGPHPHVMRGATALVDHDRRRPVGPALGAQRQRQSPMPDAAPMPDLVASPRRCRRPAAACRTTICSPI